MDTEMNGRYPLLMKNVTLSSCILLASISFLALPSFARNGGQAYGGNYGTGAPYSTSIGFNYLNRLRTFSFEASYATFSMNTGQSKLSSSKPEVSVRYHPSARAFYLGAAYGSQELLTKESGTIGSSEVETKLTTKSTTMSPIIGWMWGAGNDGVFVDLSFGLQISSGAKTSTKTNADASTQASTEYIQMEKSIKEHARKYGEQSFTYALIRVGYLF